VRCISVRRVERIYYIAYGERVASWKDARQPCSVDDASACAFYGIPIVSWGEKKTTRVAKKKKVKRHPHSRVRCVRDLMLVYMILYIIRSIVSYGVTCQRAQNIIYIIIIIIIITIIMYHDVGRKRK